MKKSKSIRNAKTFDELLDIEYGKIGTTARNEFEERALYFIAEEMREEAGRETNMNDKSITNY